MATWDVPGLGDAYRDELGMGCWAEADDGSLILVWDTEEGPAGMGRRVIFEVIDLGQPLPVSYKDAMPLDGFRQLFAWTADGRKTRRDKWLWHNRSPFPWNRVMAAGIPPGTNFTLASGYLTAAQRIAESLGKLSDFRPITPEEIEHRISLKSTPAGRAIVNRLQSAISRLRP